MVLLACAKRVGAQVDEQRPTKVQQGHRTALFYAQKVEADRNLVPSVPRSHA